MRDVYIPSLDDLAMIASWLCEEDRRELAATRDINDYETLARDAFNSHIKWAVHEDARPIFAFGAYPLEPGVAVVWGFKTEAGWAAVPLVTKHIQKCMIPELRAMGIRRAVCLVHPDNNRSQKWLAFMGFEPVATYMGIGTPDLLVYQRDEADATFPERNGRLH